ESKLSFYSLMDGPSVCGAYSFTVQPGRTTVAKVKATLFFRNEVERVGIAPLTSMFWIGKTGERTFRDYRPEVHDSDGMLVHFDSGEILWRPLVNGSELRTSVFEANDVRGFGLMQRERNFRQYEDLWNPYHRTPSLFIAPDGWWGRGRVWLVEFPTTREIDDNVVLFWEPESNPQAGDRLEFSYKMSWLKQSEKRLSPNRVVATRTGGGQDFGKNAAVANQERMFAIEFTGPKLRSLLKQSLEPGQEAPQIEVVASSYPEHRITSALCVPNPHNRSWRAMLRVNLGASDPPPSMELRCFLKLGDEVMSETWSYLWSP
ncbi:MAG: glucan biosynthesis protein, partial [Verrucomicrobiota bacterium]